MKKLISIILAIAVLCICMPAFAEEAILEFKYDKELKVLNALNIITVEDGSKPASRGEFVAAVAKLSGYSGEQIPANTYFRDVYAGHPCEGAIAYAAGTGMVVGDGGVFRPDEAITLDEAVIVLLRALGYEKFMKYGQSVMSIADDAGILDGFSTSVTSLNFDSAAKLIYNGMHSFTVTVSGGNISDSYTDVTLEKSDKTLLNTYLKIYAIEAVMTDNGLSSINGNSTVSPGFVKLGREVYAKGELNTYNLLGHKLEAYYDEEDRLVYACDITKDKDVLEIPAEKIQSAGGGSIIYEKENSGFKTVNYELASPVIYNGRALKAGEFTASMLKPAIGGIKLLRTADSSNYNLLVVTDAFNCVVDSVYENEGIYSFTDVNSATRNVKIDTEDIGITVNIYGGGTKIACESIKQYDILTVARSLDGQVMDIHVSTDTVSGAITQLKGGAYPEIQIDNTFYKISGGADTFDMTPGAKGTFYLDMFGKVAFFLSGEDSNKIFAYLIKTNVFDDDNKEIRFKIFDRTGQIKLLEGADKIIVDGTPVRESAFDTLKTNLDGMTQKVIMYEVNADGQIKAIDTASRDISVEGENTLREVETLAFGRTYSGYNLGLQFYGNVNEGIFDGQVYIDDKTIVMGIPYGSSGDDEDYLILSKSHFVSQRYYSVTPFTNDGNSDVAKVLLVSYTPKYDVSLESVQGITVMPSVEARNMQTGVVIDSYIAINSEGEAATFIKLLNLKSKSEQVYTLRWTELESILTKGSVVRYYVLNEKIVDAEKIFDLDAKIVSDSPRDFYGATKTYVVEDGGRALSDNISSSVYGRTAAWYMAYLDVMSVKGNILTAVTHDAASYSRSSDTTGALIEKYAIANLSNVYKYEPMTQTLNKASVADVVAYENTQSECSKILVFSENGMPFGMIIVE